MITSFTQLNTWKEGHKLVLYIYRAVRKFPHEEIYVLTSQMLRAVISITLNVAEGFTRKGKQEKTRFYYIAKASLTELQNQLIIARDVGYIKKKEFEEIAEQTVIVRKLLIGLIRGI